MLFAGLLVPANQHLFAVSTGLKNIKKAMISVDGIELTNDLKKIDEVRKEVGMVFQHFNLFPHLTILENCTLAPIWVRNMPKAEAEEIAMHYLDAGKNS